MYGTRRRKSSEERSPRSEVRSQGRRSRRGGTPRGVAVCLCFPAIREASRGRYQGAPFGVPSPLKEGGENQKPNSRGGAGTKRRGCLNLPNQNLRQDAHARSVSPSRKRGPIPSVGSDA